MTKNYTQLSLVQRYQIEALWKAGMKQKFIAEQIGVHPSTISRELNRNTPTRGIKAGLYGADQAQEKSQNRHHKKPKALKYNDAMKHEAARLLTYDRWSPELISATGKETGKCPISHEYLYQWIWRCKHEKNRENKAYKGLYQFLRDGRRKRNRGQPKGFSGHHTREGSHGKAFQISEQEDANG
jgi:IS30 family transposase